MKARPMRESDIPALRAMAEASGYPYPDLTQNIEAVYVVVGEDDQPIMAVAAERIVQLYLYADASLAPAAKLHAIRLLHEPMAAVLREKGYAEANAFLPPSIAAKFGRRLAKSFGWAQNWPSWFLRL